MHAVDIMPTLATLVGAKVPEIVDGFDLWSTFSGVEPTVHATVDDTVDDTVPFRYIDHTFDHFIDPTVDHLNRPPL